MLILRNLTPTYKIDNIWILVIFFLWNSVDSYEQSYAQFLFVIQTLFQFLLVAWTRGDVLLLDVM